MGQFFIAHIGAIFAFLYVCGEKNLNLKSSKAGKSVTSRSINRIAEVSFKKCLNNEYLRYSPFLGSCKLSNVKSLDNVNYLR